MHFYLLEKEITLFSSDLFDDFRAANDKQLRKRIQPLKLKLWDEIPPIVSRQNWNEQMNNLLHLYWNFPQLFAEIVHASAKSSHHQSLDELYKS